MAFSPISSFADGAGGGFQERSHFQGGNWKKRDTGVMWWDLGYPIEKPLGVAISNPFYHIPRPRFGTEIGGFTLFIYIYGYGPLPINAIFRGMNIHLPAILMWTTGVQGFDPYPYMCQCTGWGKWWSYETSKFEAPNLQKNPCFRSINMWWLMLACWLDFFPTHPPKKTNMEW